jgi:Undecaprenyl-phosphate glucose phosphotransferase
MLDDQPDRRHRPELPDFGRLEARSRRRDGDWGGSVSSSVLALPFLRELTSIDRRATPDGADSLLNDQAYAAAALFVDCLAIVAMSIASGVLYDAMALQKLTPLLLHVRNGVVVAVLFFAIAKLKGSSLPVGTSLPYERARAGLAAWIDAFVMFLFLAFVLKAGAELSRGATLLFFVAGSLSVVLTRVNGPAFAAHLLNRNALASRDIIVVGPQSDPAVMRLVAKLRGTLCESPYVVTFDDSGGPGAWAGVIEDVLTRTLKAAHSARPGEVLVVGGRLSRERLSSLVEGLAEIPRSICLVPDRFTASCLRQKISMIGQNVAIEVQREPLDAAQRAVKRMVDVVLSSLAIVFLSPLLVAVAVAVKIDSKGPVLFRQNRTGYRGRTFKILKFRTMTVMEDGPVVAQANRNDFRVTKLGAFLRKSSVDELPQLFNVLKGDMSLVGPRPHAVAHDQFYEREITNYALRQHVCPGITGWAQVNGWRGGTSRVEDMRRRVEHDIWYVRHCSVLLDLQIMARTLFEIFQQPNAY